MNKLSIIIGVVALVAVSCTKTVEVETYAGGVCVGECQVSAAAGEVSVLVETKGVWHVVPCDSWLHTDVPGGSGTGAFTVRFDSNESDVLNLRPGHTGRIAICLDNEERADTLRIVQFGFLTPIKRGTVQGDSALKLEFQEPSISEKTLLVVSTDGNPDALTWAEGKADLIVIDGVVSGESGELGVVGCDFSSLDAGDRYAAFHEAVDMAIETEGKEGVILCGSMYHYSMMQTAYPSTPEWYPADAMDDVFGADRYAWQNRFYDIMWMAQRNYLVTYTENGHSWAADYLYVSSEVLSKVSSAQIMDIPLPGMSHHPLSITLNY